MWSNNYLFCLIRGHTLLAFTYEGAEYQYCLRCGKIESSDVFKKNFSAQDSSQHLTKGAVGMLRITSITNKKED